MGMDRGQRSSPRRSRISRIDVESDFVATQEEVAARAAKVRLRSSASSALAAGHLALVPALRRLGSSVWTPYDGSSSEAYPRPKTSCLREGMGADAIFPPPDTGIAEAEKELLDGINERLGMA